MIDIKQLRIGNYLAYVGGFVFTVNGLYVFDPEVWAIDGMDLKSKTIAKGIKEEKIVGIPLDEDWLKKFGFRKIKGIDITWVVTDSTHLKFCPYLSRNPKGSWGVYKDGHLLGYIEYVHQLQNWVYALTGQELEAK